MKWNMERYTTYIFDLDGCIYSGNRVYPGARKVLTTLIETGRHVFFLSNNSTEASQTIRNKLIDMDLPVENIPILVATELIGPYLAEKYGAARVYSIGSMELEKSLRRSGHQVLPLGCGEQCDFVVVGRDTSFTYQKLYDCVRCLTNGARLIAANLDFYHPGEDGVRVPETGSLIAAIQAVTGINHVESVGKPFSYPFIEIIQQKDLNPENCLMVGDNPYTDVKGGYSAGMHTAWISHGNSFPIELGFQPNLTLSCIGEFLEVFD
ncbi:HAD-IIA family hydrolase [Paenibacillus solisilvae]|uniref:HAD-IIA family hydrolase n=1 Tax=Paenibacillus solisilvae TaxID=2486751 RepID=A0ABW0W4U2_9BACL